MRTDTLSRMTDVLVPIFRERDCCTTDDLVRAGFTSAEILEYAGAARDAAIGRLHPDLADIDFAA
jgi:hypothetical protein